MSERATAETKQGFKFTCIWCNAGWSDQNIRLYDLDAGDHCNSGRFYPENCVVSIVCHSCDREVYRKEGQGFD